MSRILVTGATGFIGQHLVKRLLGVGNEVAAFVLDEESFLENVQVYRGNIANLSDVQRCVGRFVPEHIFHLAAQPLVDTAMRSVLDTLDSNILGGRNVLHACLDVREFLKAVVFVTTDKVYGYAENATESSPLNGINHPYSASKICADVLAQMYARSFQVPAVIVRSGNVYGEGDLNFDRIIPYVIRCVLRNETIKLRSDFTFTRDYLYIDDVINGYLTLVANIHCLMGQPVNLGAYNPVSVKELIEEIFLVTCKTVPVEVLNKQNGEISRQHLDWKMAEALGWKPKTSLRDGIRKTYLWHKERE